MSDKKIKTQPSLTKADKILSICEGLENWDQDTLVDMAKEWYATLLIKESMKTIDTLYNSNLLLGKYASKL